MASRDGGGDSISSQLRRDWVKVRVPKKGYRDFASRISNWGLSPDSKLFPGGIRGRGQQKSFKMLLSEIEEEGGPELAELVGKLRDFAMPRTLPLSGQKIVLQDVERDSRQWYIKGKSFGDNSDKDFPEIRDFFSGLERQLRVHRNAGEDQEVHWMELLVYLQAFSLIHKMSARIGTDLLLTDLTSRKHLSGMIDRHFLGCILSLETLHAGPVLEALLPQIERIELVAEEFARISGSIFDDKVAIRSQSEEIQKACRRLIDSIEKDFTAIQQSSHRNPIPAESCMEIVKAISKLESVSRNNIGQLILKGPLTRNLMIFKVLGARPNGIDLDYDGAVSIIYERTSEFAHNATTLYNHYSPSPEDVEYSTAIEADRIPVLPLEITIREDMLASDSTEGESWIDEYEEAEKRLKQIASVLGEEKADQEAATREADKAREIMSGVKDSRTADIEAVTLALRNPPDYFVNRHKDLSERAGFEVLTQVAIGDIERFLSSSPSSSRSTGRLVRKLEEMGINHEKSLEIFQPLIDKVELVKEKYRRTKREIRRAEGVTAHQTAARWKDVKDQFKSLQKKFQEKVSQIRDQNNNDETERQLSSFSNEMASDLDRIDEECENLLAGNVRGGGTGTLLIGLGQGGQQILRAMIANLMNTTYDERSRNILRSIGMEMDDIETVGNMMVEYQGKIDRLDEKKAPHDYAKLQAIFDQCNILAMNLGREIVKLLGQSYGFIWGGRKKESIARRKVERLSSNLLLLDPEGRGAGGKLGKGRAYADESKTEINQTLHGYKSRNRRITHVALIHSFAGGSGSGMILPMLTEIKQQFPTADVWTFSAGPGSDDTAEHGSQNVTYITSEILQSYHNALHHRIEKITHADWTRFNKNISDMQGNMRGQWKKTLGDWLDPQGKIQSSRSYSDEYKKECEDGSGFGFSPPKSNDTDDWGESGWKEKWSGCTPENEDDAQKFSDSIRDKRYENDAAKIWEKWTRAADDPMQRLLQPLLEGSKTSQSSSDSEGRDYPVTRTHLRQLELYLEKINNWNQKGEDPEAQFEQEKDRRGGSVGSTGAADWSEELIEFACQLTTPESQDPSDNIELRNALRNYSSSMQTFQDEVEEMNERILMNRGANDDNKIKHFIVSNSHLDKSAGNLTTGTLYEIYNSTMVDNLVNIIHSLVADMNVSEDDASVLLGGSTAKDSTAQIMDLSDMRARTMPISSAMSIDLSNSAEVSYNTRYNEDSADQLFSGNSSIRKEALASLFTNAESPLYDSIDGQGNLPLRGKWIDALCYNFFADDDLLRVHPRDAISMIRELAGDWPEELSVNDNERERRAKKAYQNLIQGKEEIIVKNFTEESFLNMIRWILLIPPEIIKGYMVSDVSLEDSKDFDSVINSWSEGHKNIENEGFANKEFTRKGRVTEFANLISRILVNTGINSNERSTLAELLVSQGILDSSHLAIVPSAYLSDSAAWSMMSDSIDLTELGDEVYQKFDFVKLVGSPTASTELSEKLSKGAREMQGILANEGVQKIIMNRDNWHNFLRVRQHGRMNDRTNVVTHTTRFAELISGLKFGVASDYPETGTYSLVDLLVTRGSNPAKGVANPFERSKSERPEFLLVRNELARMSLSRKMYNDEPISVTATRNLLLGRPLSMLDERERSFRDTYLGHYGGDCAEFFQLVQERGGEIKFGEKEFKPPEFANSVKNRLLGMMDLYESIEGVEFDSKTQQQSHSVMLYLCKRIEECQSLDEEAENDDTNIREILSDLSKSIRTITKEQAEEILTGEFGERHQFEISEVGKELTLLALFLDQLGNMYFQGERQYQYRFGKSGEGRGVSFDFDGTIDAVRTVSSNYLAILNHSVDLPTTLINRSVQYYFQDFLEQEKAAEEQTATGGFFSQHLSSGPLAHLTIVQQGSGPVELSSSFDNLMTTLDRKGVSSISRTLIHPYSFIKNMLWISTFRGQWLSRTSKVEPRYAESFDIGAKWIEKVFGSPKKIQQEIYSVRQSNELSGIRLPSMDNEAWDLLKRITDNPTAEDLEILERKHYLLTDLLMINWMRCKAIEDAIDNKKEGGMTIQERAERNVSKMLEKPEEHMDEILQKYPKNLWGTRIERRFKSNYLYYPEISEEEEDEKPKTGLSALLPGNANGNVSPMEDYRKQKEAWLECLNEWTDFSRKMAEESQSHGEEGIGEGLEETNRSTPKVDLEDE